MLVALDTCVLAFLLEPQPVEKVREQRWLGVREAVRKWETSGATLMIPSPCIAELAADPQQGGLAMELLAKRFRTSLDIRPMDGPAAELAGDITRGTLKMQPRPDSKVVLKFDATILATAIRWKADKLATTNERDFAKQLPHLPTGRTIEVAKADAQSGQLVMIPTR